MKSLQTEESYRVRIQKFYFNFPDLLTILTAIRIWGKSVQNI